MTDHHGYLLPFVTSSSINWERATGDTQNFEDWDFYFFFFLCIYLFIYLMRGEVAIAIWNKLGKTIATTTTTHNFGFM